MGTGIRWDFLVLVFFGVFFSWAHSLCFSSSVFPYLIFNFYFCYFFTLPYFFLVPLFLVPPMIAAVGPSVGYGSGPREKVWL